MNPERLPQVALYGNLGDDSEIGCSEEAHQTKEIYDATEDVRVRAGTGGTDRELRAAGLAVNFKDADGEDLLRWIRLVDQDYLVQRRKGDRLMVRGWFRDRKYLDKEGQERTLREFILASAELQSMKIRHDDSVPRTSLGQAPKKNGSRAKKAA